MRVLVADDEMSITSGIGYALRREGYEVETAMDGEDVLAKIVSFQPHVLILDIMMPKRSGYEICKKYEQRTTMGIILLTAKTDIMDKVLGLELGADDYVTKPFDMRELLARVKSLARRFEMVLSNSLLSIGQLVIDHVKRKVTIAGCELDLTPKEFDLLYLLGNNLERVYQREELLELVWEMDYVGGTRTVDIHIQRLRKKLGSYKEMIQTVYRVGYRLKRMENS